MKAKKARDPHPATEVAGGGADPHSISRLESGAEALDFRGQTGDELRAALRFEAIKTLR